LPLAYDPPVANADELQIELQAGPDHPDLVGCWQQKAPVRRLTNLAGIPVLLLTGEASTTRPMIIAPRNTSRPPGSAWISCGSKIAACTATATW
jgi:hypothetical protein